MTATIRKLFRRLDRPLHPIPGDDEVAGATRPAEPEMPLDEVAWLDRYLFDREWRRRQR